MNTGDNDHFSQKGGARVGMLNVSLPFAKLFIFRNALRLSCVEDYVFAKDSIVALTRYREFISDGLQIQHSVPTYPAFIVFWVSPFALKSRFAVLKARMEAFGYVVQM